MYTFWLYFEQFNQLIRHFELGVCFKTCDHTNIQELEHYSYTMCQLQAKYP